MKWPRLSRISGLDPDTFNWLKVKYCVLSVSRISRSQKTRWVQASRPKLDLYLTECLTWLNARKCTDLFLYIIYTLQSTHCFFLASHICKVSPTIRRSESATISDLGRQAAQMAHYAHFNVSLLIYCLDKKTKSTVKNSSSVLKVFSLG